MLTDTELAEMTDEERLVVLTMRRLGGDPCLERLAVLQAHEVEGIGPRSAAFAHPGYSVAQPLRPSQIARRS
jgi:hypothetical protein